jgi:hypothetical protein
LLHQKFPRPRKAFATRELCPQQPNPLGSGFLRITDEFWPTLANRFGQR